jgi:hypothetical protein
MAHLKKLLPKHQKVLGPNRYSHKGNEASWNHNRIQINFRSHCRINLQNVLFQFGKYAVIVNKLFNRQRCHSEKVASTIVSENLSMLFGESVIILVKHGIEALHITNDSITLK